MNDERGGMGKYVVVYGLYLLQPLHLNINKWSDQSVKTSIKVTNWHGLKYKPGTSCIETEVIQR